MRRLRTLPELSEPPVLPTRRRNKAPSARWVTATAGTDHQPDRPSWDCRACDKPWPCDPAREQLIQTYGRRTLSMFAVDRLSEAARDIPTMTPAELFERFLSWTRPAVRR